MLMYISRTLLILCMFVVVSIFSKDANSEHGFHQVETNQYQNLWKQDFGRLPFRELVWWHLSKEDRLDRLQTEIALYANYYAASRGYRFGDGAKGSIDGFSRRAAGEINVIFGFNRFPDYKEMRDGTHKLLEVKRNFRMLIDRMVFVSKAIPDYEERSPGVIGEQTLEEALRDLCPIWPLCRK